MTNKVTTFRSRAWPIPPQVACEVCGHRFDEHCWTVRGPDFGACPPYAIALSREDWGTQRVKQFDVNGASYSVEQVVEALRVYAVLPGMLDRLGANRSHEYDPGWQEALAQMAALLHLES